MIKKRGKITSVILIIAMLVFAGIQFGCSGSSQVDELAKEVQESIQNTMSSITPFSEQDIIVNKVTLEKIGEYNYKGTSILTLSGTNNEIIFDVIFDGQNIVWYIEPSAFDFLDNSPADTVRVGLRTKNIVSNNSNISIPNERTDFKYDLNATRDGVVILEYVGARSDVVIPAILDGFPVMEISEGAFRGNEIITSFVLPPIKAILTNTFRDCKNLVSVILPDTLIYIGDDAFENCQSLVSIIIPESVTYIGRGAFFDCISLTSVSLPNNIESIERSTFMNCSLLTSINIPESVKFIFYQAFRNCSNLLEVNLPSNQITYIGGNASVNNDHYQAVFNSENNTIIRQARPLRSVGIGIGMGNWETIDLSDLALTIQLTFEEHPTGSFLTPYRTGTPEFSRWYRDNMVRYRRETHPKFFIKQDPNNRAFEGCFRLDLQTRDKIKQSGYEGMFN